MIPFLFRMNIMKLWLEKFQNIQYLPQCIVFISLTMQL